MVTMKFTREAVLQKEVVVQGMTMCNPACRLIPSWYDPCLESKMVHKHYPMGNLKRQVYLAHLLHRFR